MHHLQKLVKYWFLLDCEMLKIYIIISKKIKNNNEKRNEMAKKPRENLR